MPRAKTVLALVARKSSRRKPFYKENWFIGLGACAALFASLGAGWPFVADMWSRHDAAVETLTKLEVEVGDIDRRLTSLENLRDIWRKYSNSVGHATPLGEPRREAVVLPTPLDTTPAPPVDLKKAVDDRKH